MIFMPECWRWSRCRSSFIMVTFAMSATVASGALPHGEWIKRRPFHHSPPQPNQQTRTSGTWGCFPRSLQLSGNINEHSKSGHETYKVSDKGGTIFFFFGDNTIISHVLDKLGRRTSKYRWQSLNTFFCCPLKTDKVIAASTGTGSLCCV